jgi:hypothetical protein
MGADRITTIVGGIAYALTAADALTADGRMRYAPTGPKCFSARSLLSDGRRLFSDDRRLFSDDRRLRRKIPRLGIFLRRLLAFLRSLLSCIYMHYRTFGN